MRRKLWASVTIGACAVAIVASAAPMLANAADHADAPGNLVSPSGRRDADINDVYAFGTARNRTAFAFTTHPAVGVLSPSAYGTDVEYKLNIDRNGDAIEDQVYSFKFRAPDANGVQRFKIKRTEGGRTTRIGESSTNTSVELAGGVKVFAGLRSDPFFFDLDAFKHVVAGDPSRSFCDAGTTDFFSAFDTNAIVVEVRNSNLPKRVGVWASTQAGGKLIDQMGRPAINTVFNKGTDKDDFNRTRPSDQATAFGGKFLNNVKNTLGAFSGLDSEGAYSASQLDTLAGVLIPDVLPYDIGTPTVGALNGRALADDVIDNELNLVTGGFAFAGRNGTGAVPSDCVAAHTDYLTSFPYLGMPH